MEKQVGMFCTNPVNIIKPNNNCCVFQIVDHLLLVHPYSCSLLITVIFVLDVSIGSESVSDTEASVKTDETGTVALSELLLSESEGDGDESCPRCPICLARLTSQAVGSPEACDHSFCLECILEWAKVTFVYFHCSLISSDISVVILKPVGQLSGLAYIPTCKSLSPQIVYNTGRHRAKGGLFLTRSATVGQVCCTGLTTVEHVIDFAIFDLGGLTPGPEVTKRGDNLLST